MNLFDHPIFFTNIVRNMKEIHLHKYQVVILHNLITNLYKYLLLRIPFLFLQHHKIF